MDFSGSYDMRVAILPSRTQRRNSGYIGENPQMRNLLRLLDFPHNPPLFQNGHIHGSCSVHIGFIPLQLSRTPAQCTQ